VGAGQLHRDAAIRVARSTVKVHHLGVVALGKHLERELTEQRHVARDDERLEDRRLRRAETREPPR
jgi:hypothetical protein